MFFLVAVPEEGRRRSRENYLTVPDDESNGKIVNWKYPTSMPNLCKQTSQCIPHYVSDKRYYNEFSLVSSKIAIFKTPDIFGLKDEG